MTPISRADAAQKIRQHWLDTYTKEQILATGEPDWNRLRNYEFEGMLREAFGGDWVIGEWCPFNGVYCAWSEHAPDAVIEETAKRFEGNADALRADGFAPDRMAAYVRHRGRTSKCRVCGIGTWGDSELCADHTERHRQMTKEGSRVRLVSWGSADASRHVQPGDEGVVDLIDDSGTVHVRWDSGATVGMLPRVDRWVLVTGSTERCPSST